MGWTVRNKTLCWCAATLVLLTVNGEARHKDVERLPFQLYRNHLIIVSGRLGSIEKRNLLIDTGASPTIIDEALAHELGLKPIGQPGRSMAVVGGVAQTYYAVLQSLDIGPVHRESLVVAVANLSLMQAGVGLRIDAIVGLDALAPNNFQIDYTSRKVVFGNVHMPASAVAMLPGVRFVAVESQVNGANVSLALDTGSAQVVLFRNGVPEAISGVQARATVQLSNVVGDLLAPEIELANFKVGHEDLSGSTAVLTTVPNCCEFQGILGISASRFKRVTFDFQRRLVGLESLKEDTLLEPDRGSCPSPMDPSCREVTLPGFLNTKR